MKHQGRRNGSSGPGDRAPPTASSGQVSVLCCRIVALQDGIELERPIRSELLQVVRAPIDQVVLRFHGYVMHEQPQRLWACFADMPGGHDGARRALLAGVELSTTPERTRVHMHGNPPTEIAFCVGVHTGRIAIGDAGTVEDEGSADLDKLTALATQMADEAGARGVVASEATFRAAQAHFRFRELSTSTRAGGVRLTRLYEAFEQPAPDAQTPASPAAIAQTPLCGRHAELDFLLRCWQRAAQGEAPVAVVTGAAGIGKTRLARALRESLILEPHEVLECACSELLHTTSLHPFVELLEERLGLTREHGAAERLSRLRAEFDDEALGLGRALPLFAALLGIPGVAQSAEHVTALVARSATLDAVITWLHALAARRPALVLLEDLQWADASTLELVGRLIAAGPQPGLMLVLTHRPEFELPWTSTRLWELVLEPLGPRDSARVVAAVARSRPLTDGVVRDVLAKADGVPLYLEEITKAWLQQSAPHPHRATTPQAASNSLSRRLQGLGPSRTTLQLGAVLGPKFRFELLAAVSEQEQPALRNHVQKLLEVGLWQPQPGAPEETYVFKHALLHEAAYESIPRRTLRAYHSRVAHTVVERFPELARTQPEFLARQFAAADLAEPALDHWTRAGAAARERCAYGEAIQAYTKALEQLGQLPPSERRSRQEIELRTTRGVALISVLGYAAPEVEENYSRALELCEQLEDVSFGVVYGIWCVFLVRGDLEPAQRLARSFQRMTQAADPLVQFCANAALGTHARFSGDHRSAQSFVDRAALHYKPESAAAQLARVETEYGYDGYLFPYIYGASSRILRGYMEQGWALGLRARELAEATQHPYAMAMTFGFLSNLASGVVGDFALGREFAAREMSLALEHGFGFWGALSSAHAGFAEARMGNYEIGLAQLNSSIRQLEKLSGLGPVMHAQQFLAEAYLLAGDAQQALRVSEEMLRNARGRLAGIYVPWALRVNGAALAVLGDAVSAETQLRASMEVARSQDARVYELRAAVCLARLLRDTQRAVEAQALLGPIYEWFTEGLQWPDLRAARELLATL